MKRTFAVSDLFYRLTHTIKRNRFSVLLYIAICLVFLVVGIAVGVNVTNKTDFVLRNNASIFRFLRGDIGIVTYFFLDLLMTCIYALFAASMFFYKALTFLSIMPCAYRSYILGMNVSIIIVVFSVSSIPMLFVLYVPICIIEIIVLCMLSFGCFRFYAMNGSCMPSKADIKFYYKNVLSVIIFLAVCTLVKAAMLALFGSALIGII
ncbi:MAG: hypothetical protein J1G01_05120 [Clostridiales bacterium]|nr:hypothetical protein [Clostridiales bacterium]